MSTATGFPPPASLFETSNEPERSFKYVFAAAADLELDPWPLMEPDVEGMELLDGPTPERFGRVLWKSPDETQLLLVEELGPCRFIGRHGGEMVYMIKGHVRGKPTHGKPYELRPGDVAWFEAGMEDTWEVVERYRKILWVAADRPLPYPGPAQ